MSHYATRGANLHRAAGSALVAAALALAGCANPSHPTVAYPSASPSAASPPVASPSTASPSTASHRYLPPTSQTLAPPRVILNAPLEVAQRQVLTALERSPLEIFYSDPGRQVIVAHYSGAPQPYVDCGLLVWTGGGQGEAEVVPAAAASSRMVDAAMVYDRRMRLDSRLVVRFEALGQQTALVPAATYVLSKVVADPRTGRWGRETIDFSSGATSRFKKGTSCHPTGALEAIAHTDLPQMAPLPVAPPPPAPEMPDARLVEIATAAVPQGGCAVIEASRTATGAVVLSGIVSDLFTMDSVVNALTFDSPALLVQNRLAVLSAPSCEAYRLLEPYRAPAGSGLELEIANLGALADGDAVRLALRLPPDRTNLHVVQFLDQERIGQLELAARSPAPGVTWSIDTGHRAGPPDQQSLVLAVASDEPLFASPRPPVEPAEAFLPALRQALAERGFGARAPVSACALVAVPAGGAASDPCL